MWDFLKGMAMGAADIVPGVSGGTIALVTGIYERLISAIKNVGVDTVKSLFQNGFKATWKKMDGPFLLTLFAGMATSIVAFAQVLHFAIEQYPMFIWPCFFGLVLASVLYVGRQVGEWNWQRTLLLVLGVGIAAMISLSSATEIEVSPLTLFLSGALAICAMILPGISGSFILLLLGMYSVVITAVKSFDFYTLIVFGSGCVVGLMIFSRFLSWLLARFHSATMALLTGFMLGALIKLWPWKEVIETRVNSKGVSVPWIELPISPFSHHDPHLLMVVLSALFGFALVIILERSFSQSTKAA
jgi:putative membrane protein